jgi:hypothetical protein
MTYRKIIQSPYGKHVDNFHLSRRDDALEVALTYPPWTDADNKGGQLRHVQINQESVRASDGIRVHYDYERDGFVIEQPKVRYEPDGEDALKMVEEWIEVAFCPSWRFGDGTPDGSGGA